MVEVREHRRDDLWMLVAQELGDQSDFVEFMTPLVKYLGTDAGIVADPQRGLVSADITGRLTPDEARLIGVRLIEAAALADSNRAIRGTPEAVQA